jgi:hypothetical protein
MTTSFSGRTLGKKTCDHMLVVKYCEGSNIQGEEGCISMGIQNQWKD